MSAENIIYSSLLAQHVEETETAVSKARVELRRGRDALWAAIKRREVDRVELFELGMALVEQMDAASDHLLNAQLAAGQAAGIVGPWNKQRPSVDELMNQLLCSHANHEA